MLARMLLYKLLVMGDQLLSQRLNIIIATTSVFIIKDH
jgi:hypothetical protein